MCNAQGECVPADSLPTLCINYMCEEGYALVNDAATRPGNDRATCCYRTGVCAGAPEGAMCSLGDIDSSLIPNPSFEDFFECPDNIEQLSRSTTWVQATGGTSDFFVGSPACDDSWFRNGYMEQLGSVPQLASDGNAFVGSIKDVFGYYEYVGTCLTDPLVADVEYTFTLNVAAPEDDFIFGGDTNGATDLLCIPECNVFPIPGSGYKGNDFQILSSAEPEGGLIGGADWKTITFNFVADANCSAIMFGPSITQTIQDAQEGSYVIYDFLNFQEGAAGMCNAEGECVPGSETEAPETNFPSSSPTDSPTVSTLCINYMCEEGYALVNDAATRPGNDRATCCYRIGVCAGAPEGAMCSLGDIDSSLIPNPSFEDFTVCPDFISQLNRSAAWVQATEATTDFFVQPPACDDTWFRTGDDAVPQLASDGSAFVGTLKAFEEIDYSNYEYVGACLNQPLATGVEYTFTLDVAASSGLVFGGDTNGVTDLLCIPDCTLFPIPGIEYKGREFEILATSEPAGGLVGGGDWKTMTFNFVPTIDCPAIMFGPGINQTIQPSQVRGSYVLYDFLNLQEGASGMCNSEGECVPVDSETEEPETAAPAFNELCIAVIAESDVADNVIQNIWTAFRNRYPSRPLCVLIPYTGNVTEKYDFYLPGDDPDFYDDEYATYDFVFQDNGDPALASDYLSSCESVSSGNIDFVALYIDESTRRSTVKASLSNLFQDLEANNVTYCTVGNDGNGGDWITPFYAELVDTCVSTLNPTATPYPTISPTGSAMPTTTYMPTIYLETISPLTLNTSNVSTLSTSEPLEKLTQAPAVSMIPTNAPVELKLPSNESPSLKVTTRPTLVSAPTLATEPTAAISTNLPNEAPTLKATSRPMTLPTLAPFDEPTLGPTVTPTQQPIKKPTNEPTVAATNDPTKEPIAEPTRSPEVDTKSPSI